MERMSANVEPSRRCHSSLDQLREIMGGDMEAGNLYGMLSSSGEGKTSLALQIMDHAASQGHPVVFLSYDQSEEQCIDQIISQRTGIENTRIRDKTRLTEREMTTYFDTLTEIKKLPLFIRKCSSSVDGSAQLAAYVRSLNAKRLKRFDKPALVGLDHSRKVKPKNENAHEGRIAAEANGVFKQIAADLGLVWFNLMQRSSFGTKRKNPRPIDSDIYGGESGKEDYDGVFYLYRGWKYWKTQLATAESEKDEEKITARFQREKWQEDEAEVGALKARFADASRFFASGSRRNSHGMRPSGHLTRPSAWSRGYSDERPSLSPLRIHHASHHRHPQAREHHPPQAGVPPLRSAVLHGRGGADR
jgi:replicative DNA helicase